MFPNYGGRFGYTPQTCADARRRAALALGGGKAGARRHPPAAWSTARVLEMLDFYGATSCCLSAAGAAHPAGRRAEATAAFAHRRRTGRWSPRMSEAICALRRALPDHPWEGVDLRAYKDEADAPFTGVIRACSPSARASPGSCAISKWRPAAIPRSSSTSPCHAVMILRGAGRVLVGDEVFRSRPLIWSRSVGRGTSFAPRRAAARLPLPGRRDARPTTIAARRPRHTSRQSSDCAVPRWRAVLKRSAVSSRESGAQ